MTDQSEANFFLYENSQRIKKSVISSPTQVCEKNADFYNVNHPNRGVALIFNHSTYNDKDIPVRKGTEKDKNDMKRVLEKLEFDVRIYNDLSYYNLYKILKSVSNEDHTNSDCLVVVVMSHGVNGLIHAKDGLYSPEHLWLFFRGDKCPTLAGKPKLFFLQACQGNNVDDGVSVRSVVETDSCDEKEKNFFTIPMWADILVMYSSYPGYYSWRNETNGSWFIQELCQELENNFDKYDLATMLTFVNKKVAIDHESYTPLEIEKHKKKQICPIVSMLTRLVVFPPKRRMLVAEDGGNPDDNASAERSGAIDENDDD